MDMLFYFFLSVMVFLAYMMFRNNWVYDERTRMLFDDYGAYKRLPSYQAVLWRFWVWDINKFDELRRAIEAKDQRIAEECVKGYRQGSEDNETLMGAQVERLKERIAELEKGLEPFKRFADAVVEHYGENEDPDDDNSEPISHIDLPKKYMPTYQDCRHAADLLKKPLCRDS